MSERNEPTGEPIAVECTVEAPEAENGQESALMRGNGQSGPAPFSPERAKAKEEIKLAFVTGKHTLASLASRYLIPLTTIQQWSAKENWGEIKETMLQSVNGKVVASAADMLAKEREAQIRRSLVRSRQLQDGADKILLDDEGKVKKLEAGELQALAVAEDRADQIARRNLGMEDKGGNSTSFNVNFIGSANFG